MSRTLTRFRAAAVVAACASAALLAVATPASAHVTVDPKEVPAGGYSTVNVKVPNERDNASTIKIELFLDPDHPVASAMPQPVPGWEIDVEITELEEPLEVHGNEITEAPRKITWRGGEIRPGMFQQFPVSLGRLPEDAGQLTFKAIQTYDNDEVVRWIDEPAEDAEHPAAVLTLAPAAEEGHGSAPADAENAENAENGESGEGGTAVQAEEDSAPGGDTGSATSSAAPDSADTAARVLAVLGLLVGAAGVTLALLTARRGRTTAGS
ncbi:YcnI family protein [Streptomyces sp. YIM 98790]|uniref:YcnI family copper-binding membrane protein n=1 Tax=Streptomyces sp. YIM 98790 TaxID=2689077 RepID=UPI0014098992|nr:YcnI family protein [Streptomyces sp. YIM 98790]